MLITVYITLIVFSRYGTYCLEAKYNTLLHTYVNHCMSFFFWSSYCLSFFNLRLLIAPLISSNFLTGQCLYSTFVCTWTIWIDGYVISFIYGDLQLPVYAYLSLVFCECNMIMFSYVFWLPSFWLNSVTCGLKLRKRSNSYT